MEHILIVDDDPAIQMLLKRTLVNQGYQVTVASDGYEGFTKAKELNPGLVICDWVMPKMNGIDVCRQIKATPELSTTFFVLLTSKGSIEDRVEGLDAGADDFLCKPIEMFELEARVRAALRLHQLSSDLQKQKHLLETELAEAAEYVRSILPEPMSEPSISIDVRFIPSRQLGGDSFDYYWLDQNHLALYLLDVSGHGLRSALPSLSVINLLRSKGLMQVNYYQPKQVLKGLNQAFQMSHRNDKYFTIWYGVYNKKNRQLVYASAGHPPAILIHRNRHKNLVVEQLKTPGFPAGMFPEVEYEEARMSIKPSSNLYIFSDGVYEVQHPDGQIWGLDRFIEELQLYQNDNKPNRNLDKIIEKAQEYNRVEHFNDDVSLIEVSFD